MSKVTAEQLLAGIIFGDNDNNEYVYLPGGEIGSECPFCVFERQKSTQDITLQEAVQLIQRLQLYPCRHPVLGSKAY